MEQTVKNIIFDFGGVLLDIDYQRTYDALSRLLNVTFEPDLLPDDAKKVLFDFETGHIHTESFIWNIQRWNKSNTTPMPDEIISGWNAMLIGWNPDKFAFLEELKEKYTVYLLSNTNELHLNWVYNDLRYNHNIIDFDHRFFTKTYYSHLIGMRKPNKDIFNFVGQDARLHPSETLFIDDIKANVEGGKSAGWQTYHHDPTEDLINICRNKLKLL
ncbi:MAG: HAD family phosphatase [Saprospiraceae bacterium]|nr:HAD family phosphatase [Saprospiraceae bacterium]